MAAYDNLRAVIAANVYQNNNNEVTADMVKTAMNAMVASLGAEFQYGGVAEPTDNPGTPDYKVAYLAATPGTYTNFGGIVVADGEVVNLKWNGTAWSKEITGALSAAAISDNLTTDDATKVLSAKQGKALKDALDPLVESPADLKYLYGRTNNADKSEVQYTNIDGLRYSSSGFSASGSYSVLYVKVRKGDFLHINRPQSPGVSGTFNIGFCSNVPAAGISHTYITAVSTDGPAYAPSDGYVVISATTANLPEAHFYIINPDVLGSFVNREVGFVEKTLYDRKDIISSATALSDKYITTLGAITTRSADQLATVYQFANNGYKFIVAFAGWQSNISGLAVAFYNSDTPGSASFISGINVVAMQRRYIVQVPEGTRTICVSNSAYGGASIMPPAIYVYQDLKQDKLESGVTIKTVDGKSLVGAGNVETSAKMPFSYGSALLIREQLPDYYTEQPANPASYTDDAYIDVKVESIPDGKHFIFITDTHWDWGNNAKHSPELISYVKNRACIDTVIFGGDYINLENTKYLAKQVLTDFAYHFLSVLGRDLLPIMGNHDTNMVNSPDEDIPVKYLPHYVNFDVLWRYRRCDGNYWDDNKDTLLAMATTAGFTDDQKRDLEAQCKMTYWWDDGKNKIRYIISDTEKPHCNPVWQLFENTIKQYMIWFYDVLRTTPAGYDVCFATHMIGTPNTAGLQGQTVLRQISSLLMGLKTRTNKKFYFSSGTNPNAEAMWPWTSHDLDFTDCAEVGKVFIIAGHAHADGISIINQDPDSYNTVVATIYDGVSIVDQVTIQTNNGCSVPVIWTTTDAFGRESDQQMVEGTITEQAFDVFTLQTGAIRMTRVGAGNDRAVYINS